MKHSSKQTAQVKKGLYQEITEKIIKALEKGTVPWRTDDTGKTVPFGVPVNAITDRDYNGINVLLLWLEQMERGFTSSRWLTFRQALKAGGNVKKGEQATLVIWYKPLEKQAKTEDGRFVYDEEGKPVMEQTFILKSHHVFNVDQCENLPEETSGIATELSSVISDGSDNVDVPTYNRIIHMIHSSGVKFSHRPIGSAFYWPKADEIVLPQSKLFYSESDYWCTVLHEMVHSTGHESRLNRIGITSKEHCFGDDVYAFEELIAEIGSAFLCAEIGITGELQHESYIDHWLDIMKADTKALIRAAKQARLASEFLLAVGFEDELSQEATEETTLIAA